ncbi:MAG TPA: Barstar (barnase inhibitor) [Bacteroidia bacterium]|nr:Barstar (barnase inhibitor) [Bacteroidia bacterium]
MQNAQQTKKIIAINGNNFFSLNGFYIEAEKALSKNIPWQNAKNLQVLNDLLLGGYGVHNYQEPITLIWENSEKSKSDLDYPVVITQNFTDNIPQANLPPDGNSTPQTLFNTLVNIIKKHPHIELLLK